MEARERASGSMMISQSIKGGLLAFVLGTIFVLILALVAKMFILDPSHLPLVNQILKVIAVAIAVSICINGDGMLIKAVMCAIIFAIFNAVLFSCLGGIFNMGAVGIDAGIAIAVAIVISLVKARKR